jgi:hypothetical protein
LNGIRFYVDGQPAGGPFDPRQMAGNLDNPAPLWLARSHPFPATAYLPGALDEVEIAHDVMTAAKILEIYQAGAAGKCPELCYATQKKPCCDGVSSTSAVTICNYDVTSHVYSYGLTALGAGPGCSSGGPMTFTPGTGTVTVPAGGCVTVPIMIGCPTNILPGQVACYQVSLYNHDTGRLFACHGSVFQPKKWCIKWNLTDKAEQVGIVTLAEGGPARFNIRAGNLSEGTAPSALDYEIRAYAGHDDESSKALSLNGLPPGEPVIGTLDVSAGTTGTVPLDAGYPRAWLIGYDRLAMYGDDDGDGVKEEIGEVAARGVPAALIGVPEGPGARSDGPGGDRLFLSVPNPFGNTGNIRFRVIGNEPAEVKLRLFDLIGRGVRTFHMESVLEPGVHSVAWKSEDDRGERLKGGLYFLRVEIGKRVETVKIVVRR